MNIKEKKGFTINDIPEVYDFCLSSWKDEKSDNVVIETNDGNVSFSRNRLKQKENIIDFFTRVVFTSFISNSHVEFELGQKSLQLAKALDAVKKL